MIIFTYISIKSKNIIVGNVLNFVLKFIYNTDIIMVIIHGMCHRELMLPRTINHHISLFGGLLMFTKDTVIGEVVMAAPQAAPLFQAIGMHCLGCAMASGETLEEACAVHGVDPDEFIAKLNKFVEENN